MSLIKKFYKNKQANIAIAGALMMPVLITCVAGAVDFTSVYASKKNLQKAADAAALAAAKEYGRTQEEGKLEKWAEAYFSVNAQAYQRGETDFQYEGAEVADGRTLIRVSATRVEPTYFGKAVKALTQGSLDIETITLHVTSEIVVQNRSIEMALVLDNSGSMTQSTSDRQKKIDVLKEAASGLVDHMMAANASNLPNPVTIGVVPFSGGVNIGPDHANAHWMDLKGVSSIHHENFDWPSWKDAVGQPIAEWDGESWRHKRTQEYLTRFYVFSEANRELRTAHFPQGWAGCVEARPSGLAITDQEPHPADPDSYFVPLFAPDEYDWHGTAQNVAKNDYVIDGSERGAKSDAARISHQKSMDKYFNAGLVGRGGFGPNFTCDTTPITPLTTQKKTVLDAIEAMQAVGSTNIPEGAAWGWRVLSERQPFAEGRPWTEKDNLKVLVLMTDGENTYNPTETKTGRAVEIKNANLSMYGPFGYGQAWNGTTAGPGRIFDATTTTIERSAADRYVDAMNEMTTKLCENIKDDHRKPDDSDGIVIFTIAFDLKDGSKVKQLLEECSSYGLVDTTRKLYYDATNARQLTAAFQAITEEISSLRIAR